MLIFQAADYLEQAEYDTGNSADDLRTHSLVRQLLYHPKLQASCPKPFDEGKFWKGQSGPQLKQMVQKQFRNIRFFLDFLELPGLCKVSGFWVKIDYPPHCSALMDCVGCEKCRLWGKLQVSGLGTALKILFSVDVLDRVDSPVSWLVEEIWLLTVVWYFFSFKNTNSCCVLPISF